MEYIQGENKMKIIFIKKEDTYEEGDRKKNEKEKKSGKEKK